MRLDILGAIIAAATARSAEAAGSDCRQKPSGQITSKLEHTWDDAPFPDAALKSILHLAFNTCVTTQTNFRFLVTSWDKEQVWSSVVDAPTNTGRGPCGSEYSVWKNDQGNWQIQTTCS